MADAGVAVSNAAAAAAATIRIACPLPFPAAVAPRKRPVVLPQTLFVAKRQRCAQGGPCGLPERPKTVMPQSSPTIDEM
jgi:hypothetical protein